MQRPRSFSFSSFSTVVSAAVLVCLVLWGAAQVADAQSCTPFQGSPLTNYKCDVISEGTNILLRANQTYPAVDAAAGASTRLFGAFVPPACRTAAIRMVCLSNFITCTTSTGLKLYPPCRSVCETMIRECSAIAETLGVSALLPDCDMITNATGTPLPAFPPDGTQCSTGPDDPIIAYSQADCPYPLLYDADGEVGEPLEMCKQKCRTTVWSDDVWIGGYVLLYVCSLGNFLTGCFLLTSWLLNPKTRRFPFNTISYFVLSLWPASFVILWGAFFNMAGEDIMCTWDDVPKPVVMDNAGDNDGQGVACVFQGIVVYYCVLACVIWWFFVNVDCALQLFLKVRIEKFRWLQVLYHIIGWGVPLIGLAFLLGFEKIGYENTFPVCQVYLDEDPSWWDWAFFFGPMMSFTLLGMLLMFPGIIYLTVLIVRRLVTGARSKLDLFSFVRLYVSLFIIWAFTIFVYAYRIDVEATRSDVIHAVEEQVRCSLLTGEECELETTFSHGLWFLTIIALTNMITLLFITLGTTKVTWEFWLRLFSCNSEESPGMHVWSVISGRHLEDDDRGFELRECDERS